MHYLLHRFSHFLRRSIRLSIRHFFQRLFRGYDDTAMWNLDAYIAKKIIKPLKRFRSTVGGYPAHLTHKKWENILDKMIFSFDLILEDKFWSLSEKERTKLDEGFKLFGKYFQHLWD